ncbi:MAG: hypothetical protein ACJ72N_00430 [Labedaea sp.]
MTVRWLLLVLLVGLAGCGGQGVSYDKEVDDLGAHIVADLKAQPGVGDAAYRYEHGLDLGQHLRIRTVLRAESATAADVQRTIDLAVRDFWLAPAKVGHLVVTVYSAANPPTGDVTGSNNPDNDPANKDRAIGSKNVEDSAAFDRPELERSYGPRPTR